MCSQTFISSTAGRREYKFQFGFVFSQQKYWEFSSEKCSRICTDRKKVNQKHLKQIITFSLVCEWTKAKFLLFRPRRGMQWMNKSLNICATIIIGFAACVDAGGKWKSRTNKKSSRTLYDNDNGIPDQWTCQSPGFIAFPALHHWLSMRRQGLTSGIWKLSLSFPDAVRV